MSENLSKESNWSGGNRPFVSTYGKLMMWFFLISDALTFSGFLAAYGFMRFEMLKYGQSQKMFLHIFLFTRRTSIVICCLNDLYLNYEFGYYGIGC